MVTSASRSATANSLPQGYHGLVILDVEDSNFTDFPKAQTARNAYMQSRVEGLRAEVIPGLSVMDAIAVVSKQLS